MPELMTIYGVATGGIYLTVRNGIWLYKESMLSILEPVKARQNRAYRKFITGEDTEEIMSFFSRKKIPTILGRGKFIDKVKKNVPGQRKTSQQRSTANLTPFLSMY